MEASSSCQPPHPRPHEVHVRVGVGSGGRLRDEEPRVDCCGRQVRGRDRAELRVAAAARAILKRGIGAVVGDPALLPRRERERRPGSGLGAHARLACAVSDVRADRLAVFEEHTIRRVRRPAGRIRQPKPHDRPSGVVAYVEHEFDREPSRQDQGRRRIEPSGSSARAAGVDADLARMPGRAVYRVGPARRPVRRDPCHTVQELKRVADLIRRDVDLPEADGAEHHRAETKRNSIPRRKNLI